MNIIEIALGILAAAFILFLLFTIPSLAILSVSLLAIFYFFGIDALLLIIAIAFVVAIAGLILNLLMNVWDHKKTHQDAKLQSPFEGEFIVQIQADIERRRQLGYETAHLEKRLGMLCTASLIRDNRLH